MDVQRETISKKVFEMKDFILVFLFSCTIAMAVALSMKIQYLNDDIHQKQIIIEKQDSLINSFESRIYPESLGDTIIKIDPNIKYLHFRIVAE